MTSRGVDRANSDKAPEGTRATRVVIYAERVQNLPTASLSVPLRPATRMIPPAVDVKFRGKNVYAIVIPIENMPVYGGDWIVWFAEKEPKPGETPLVRAPIPFRKVEPADPPSTNRTSQRVQVAALLEKSGKLSTVSVVTSAVPGLAEAVIQDITSWEFKPATRNGVAIDVEVVIEIPFNAPSSSNMPVSR
ncbi:MAG: energy transducer TonB [Acidobacteriia bacterium]|nr:energy transducer TonB [Terriglobia bacterium]